MHLLPCPECGAEIPVSPSQAGDLTTCPGCQAQAAIPRLGDLRNLPLASQPVEGDAAPRDASAGLSMAFVFMGSIAAVSLLIGSFCWIRWYLVEVSNTTESHIASLREQYETLSPGRLIREYEDMEKYGLK